MKKIEELNEEQDHLMATIAAEYEEKSLSGDDSYEIKLIREGIDFIYELADLKSPGIVICSSPHDMAITCHLKQGETIDYLGCGYDSGWTAFLDFFERIGVEFDKEWNFGIWKNFILKSGVFATILYENTAFVCIRPCKVGRNAEFNLHNESGMAIEWRDGYGEYFLNGVSMPREIVVTPAEKIDPKLVLNEKNVEVRREIVRKVGIERVCQKLGARVVDRSADGVYELLMLDLGDGRQRPYLKMKNPSIGVYHVEGVGLECQTVAQALQFRKPDALRQIPTAENGSEWYQQGDVCIWPRSAKFVKPLPLILT